MMMMMIDDDAIDRNDSVSIMQSVSPLQFDIDKSCDSLKVSHNLKNLTRVQGLSCVMMI